MVKPPTETSEDDFYAQTYDRAVPDWPGEMDFYQFYAAEVKSQGGSVLEVACGTGRVAIPLAEIGVNTVGLDLSPAMLEVAKHKSKEIKKVKWIEGDMRSFQIEESFHLALIPGHAFQNLNIPGDQVACLANIWQHLVPGGKLIIHLDHMNLENMTWLGGLCDQEGKVFKSGERFQHPQTGNDVRSFRAWTYQPATQTAVLETIWEELDSEGGVLNRIEREPISLHCVFRFEMEHLLIRAGFAVEMVYVDFYKHPLTDESPSMIWVAQRL